MENMTIEQREARAQTLHEVRNLALKCFQAALEWQAETQESLEGPYAECLNSYILGFKSMAVMFGCLTNKDLTEQDDFVIKALGKELWQ